jgi:hypothetical protein
MSAIDSNNYVGFVTNAFSKVNATIKFHTEFDWEFAPTTVVATSNITGAIISIKYNNRRKLIEAYSEDWQNIVLASSIKELFQGMKEMQKDYKVSY